MKPQDPKAEAITFRVELETTIPATSGIVVGGYHRELFADLNRPSRKLQKQVCAFGMLEISRLGRLKSDFCERCGQPVSHQIIGNHVQIT